VVSREEPAQPERPTAGKTERPDRPPRGRRRVTTEPPPGTDPEPQKEPSRHRSDENDAQLKADKPPHWG